MSVLPPRPDLDHLRRQAADLLRAARAGDEPALARIRAVSDQVILATAQLALAREYRFASWARLKTEVQRRDVLDRRDVAALTAMLAVDPNLAVDRLQRWVDHPLGASPLGYVTMLRFDTATHTWRDVDGTVEVARVLLSTIAASGGEPADLAGALINAASYGDAEVAQLLVEAGADLEARAPQYSGGVPGGTALLHAAVFGMTSVVDVLVRAGALVPDVVLAAAAGDLSRHPVSEASAQDRLLALMMAADHQRLPVIDALVAAGTPVDAVDPVWDRHPLRLAAENGRPASVRRLLELGADPSLRDGQGRDPLDLCRAGRRQHPDDPGYPHTETILLAATSGP